MLELNCKIVLAFTLELAESIGLNPGVEVLYPLDRVQPVTCAKVKQEVAKTQRSTVRATWCCMLLSQRGLTKTVKHGLLGSKRHPTRASQCSEPPFVFLP